MIAAISILLAWVIGVGDIESYGGTNFWPSGVRQMITSSCEENHDASNNVYYKWGLTKVNANLTAALCRAMMYKHFAAGHSSPFQDGDFSTNGTLNGRFDITNQKISSTNRIPLLPRRIFRSLNVGMTTLAGTSDHAVQGGYTFLGFSRNGKIMTNSTGSRTILGDADIPMWLGNHEGWFNNDGVTTIWGGDCEGYEYVSTDEPVEWHNPIMEAAYRICRSFPTQTSLLFAGTNYVDPPYNEYWDYAISPPTTHQHHDISDESVPGQLYDKVYESASWARIGYDGWLHPLETHLFIDARCAWYTSGLIDSTSTIRHHSDLYVTTVEITNNTTDAYIEFFVSGYSCAETNSTSMPEDIRLVGTATNCDGYVDFEITVAPTYTYPPTDDPDLEEVTELQGLFLAPVHWSISTDAQRRSYTISEFYRWTELLDAEWLFTNHIHKLDFGDTFQLSKYRREIACDIEKRVWNTTNAYKYLTVANGAKTADSDINAEFLRRANSIARISAFTNVPSKCVTPTGKIWGEDSYKVYKADYVPGVNWKKAWLMHVESGVTNWTEYGYTTNTYQEIQRDGPAPRIWDEYILGDNAGALPTQNDLELTISGGALMRIQAEDPYGPYTESSKEDRISD